MACGGDEICIIVQKGHISTSCDWSRGGDCEDGKDGKKILDGELALFYWFLLDQRFLATSEFCIVSQLVNID